MLEKRIENLEAFSVREVKRAGAKKRERDKYSLAEEQ